MSATDFSAPGTVYQIGLPPRRIDILTQISGVSFDDSWATRVGGEVDGRAVHFIGKDAFVRNKLAAGRPKDIADAARITKIGKR